MLPCSPFKPIAPGIPRGPAIPIGPGAPRCPLSPGKPRIPYNNIFFLQCYIYHCFLEILRKVRPIPEILDHPLVHRVQGIRLAHVLLEIHVHHYAQRVQQDLADLVDHYVHLYPVRQGFQLSQVDPLKLLRFIRIVIYK